MTKSAKTWWLLILLAGLSWAAWAEDMDPAVQLFRQGAQMERARQFGQAVTYYSQAASLTTTVYKAYISRQAGNCYYYLGLTREALVSYNIYLATYRDPAVYKIVDYLRKNSKPPAVSQTKAGQASETAMHPAEAGKFGALWRSAIVPGWGQWHRGDTWRALACFAGTLGTLSAALTVQNSADANYESYRAATEPQKASDLRDLVTQQDQFAATMRTLAVTCYSLNLLDAFFFSSSTEAAWKPYVGPYAMGKEALGASFSWRF